MSPRPSLTDPQQRRAASPSLLAGPTARAEAIAGSTMAAAISAFDWSATPLGPAERWPQSLKSAVRLMLGSRYPMFIWWGPELVSLYNDAYCDVLGPRHPWALGRSARQTWAEIWDVLAPQTDTVMQRGTATWNDRVLLVMRRKGFVEETYFTFSYSPCFDDGGAVGGVFCACTEETARVLSDRRLQTLGNLSSAVAGSRSAQQACESAAAALRGNPHDLPFVLLYLQEAAGSARLVAQAGAAAGTPLAPPELPLEGGAWPLAAAAASGPQRLEGLGARARVDAPAWHEPVQQALVLHLAPHAGGPAGFLVAGLNPRRPLDAEYRDWLGLVAQQVAGAIAEARAREEEYRRVQALAELDRAKTTFFSNVSHELRTPLALVMGPLENLLEQASGPQRRALELAQRNTRRLQRLVDTLLDFSRIEGGRLQAAFEPLDLPAYTAELASFFDSAARKGGLALRIDCRPLPERAYVDRAMWEKIVFNLLSNAIKYTLAGEVCVRLRPDGGHVLLEVQDTGVGIPPEAVPRVFERFFRVEGAHARSIEGSGIGLALVAELVRMHGAACEVDSRLGEGSTFRVRLPLGHSHLPPEQVLAHAREAQATSPLGWLDEVDGWLQLETPGELPAAPAAARQPAPSPSPARTTRGSVLLVDDNADMRSYLGSLLGREHEVRTASDGWHALRLIAERAPDLVLTDVMMARMDGFELLNRLRADPATAALPVIMLSAHADDAARLQALEAGADDFLVKPFHARELLARVSGALRLAQVRREGTLREQALRLEVQNVLESIGEGFIAVDADWRFTYVNRAAEQIYGRGRRALLGRTVWDCFPELVGSAFEAPFRRAMADGVALAAEGPYDPLGGWFEVSIYPVAGGGLSFYFRDVLQTRLMQRALRDSESRFREMAEAMPQIVYVNGPDGRLEYVSPQWKAFTGQDGAAGADLPSVVHPEDLPALKAAWRQGLRDGTPLSAQFRLRRADGSWRWFLTRAVPVRGDDAAILRWYGTSTDVDAHRRDAEALAQAHAALQQVERRKDQFIATLAHELRNPLAPLRNGVQLLELGGGADGGTRVKAMMRRQIDHLVRLVDDLLEVSRITSGKVVLQRERVALADVLHAAAETSRPLAEAARHALRVDVEALEGLAVEGDPMRLGQVFANLLNNSAKYTEPGGHIALLGRREGGEVVVEVHDDGVGLAPDMLEEVFQPFVQVDRSAARAQGGLGIGLSIVRSLLELHGGRVRARSAGAGRGSTFEVRLPLAQPQAPVEPPATDPAAAPAWSGSGPSVLVVDDNRDAADSLGSMLELMGAQVRIVYGGPDALAAVEAEAPALVLLDLGMPGMDGYEVVRRLGRHPQRDRMTVVALTGWGQAEDRQRTREAGFDDHLVKPADIGLLEQLLARTAAAEAA